MFRNLGFAGTLSKFFLGAGVLATVGNSILYNVDGGYRAVIFDQIRGVSPHVQNEGTHFYIPVIQKPIMFDVRMKPRQISTYTGTRDLQQVSVTLRVLSRPDVEKLPIIFQKLGVDYDERVLPSIGNEILKSVIAQYDAESLLTQRDKVSKEIRDSLNQRAADFHIRLDDVSIVDLAFSKEFTQAIEKKQVAQQEAERSKFIVLRTEQERQAAIIRAAAEAEAAELISKSFRQAGPGLIEIRRLEAAAEIADNLGKNRNVTYLPNGGNVLLGVAPSSNKPQ